MGKKRSPPNQPFSKYDPRSKTMSDKSLRQRPFEQRRHEKGSLCWCGNPNCDGGLQAGGGSYDFVGSTSAFDPPEIDIKAVIDAFREEMISGRGAWSTGRFFSGGAITSLRSPTSSEPPVPASLTAARKPVQEYLLDVDHDTAWDDVIGNDAARAALIEAIEEPKTHPELYEHYGMTPPKGVLLYGPPGCGKTMFAKAAAAAVGRVYGAKAEVLVVNGPAIQSSYVGETEKTIRAIFHYAREYRAHHGHPLTVFFDEAEVLFPDRTGRTRRVNSWEESQVAQFLSEMDGLNSMGAFVILATNRPEAIDEALLRDGRCDRKIKVERPTKQAVEHIVRKTLGTAPLAADLEDLVMAATESFFNPHYVIHEGHMISADLKREGGVKFKGDAINFCLEHIVSGAMVAGLARRAKSRAFARDRETGLRSGIGVQDVIGAVNEIFEENKGLEHSFALQEFVENVLAQVKRPISKERLH